jgi:hypothetical protein
VINRSTTRDIPHFPVARYEVAVLFGTLVAETILASVHVRAHQQAGHMDASDLIKLLQNTLRGGDRPHMENRGSVSHAGIYRKRKIINYVWYVARRQNATNAVKTK